MDENNTQPAEEKQNLPSLEQLKGLKIQANSKIFSRPTPTHGAKSRGVGITRKNKEEGKKTKKQGKKSRLINKKRANKKFRPTGSKSRK